MLLLSVVIVLQALILCNSVSLECDSAKSWALANNEFSFKLHKALNPRGNVFYSPASIFIALEMLYRGARGITAKEMQKALSYNAAADDADENFLKFLNCTQSTSDYYTLSVANALVSHNEYPVSEDYKEIITKYYNGLLKEVDFVNDSSAAVSEINNWISNKTMNKIPKLIDSLDPSTILVLLNAVYFKGIWESEFYLRQNSGETFYNDGVDAVTVPMMNKRLNYVPYGEQNGFRALKLPYRGEDISMVFILPNDRNGLEKVEQELESDKLNDFINGMNETTVQVIIPKFKFEDSRNLKEALMSLGMNSAFTAGAKFGGISVKGQLKLSGVFHKAVVEVNEKGSEAASGTELEIILLSLPPPLKYTFHVDHPFMFLIRDDRTGMILFRGRVNEL